MCIRDSRRPDVNPALLTPRRRRGRLRKRRRNLPARDLSAIRERLHRGRHRDQPRAAHRRL
eukprot:3273544-Alexandrium_andersonii.AAC.1